MVKFKKIVVCVLVFIISINVFTVKASDNSIKLNVSDYSTIGDFTIIDKNAKEKFNTWYEEGGSVYYNNKTKKKPIKKVNSKTIELLYVASIFSLIENDYKNRFDKTPENIGIKNITDNLNSSYKKRIRDIIKDYYKDSNVGTLSLYLKNYPGIENDIPLNELKSVDLKIENIYKVKNGYYVVSCFSYYGELRRYAYDLCFEIKSDTISLHAMYLMWES